MRTGALVKEGCQMQVLCLLSLLQRLSVLVVVVQFESVHSNVNILKPMVYYVAG